MTEKIIEEAAKKHDLADLVFVHGLNEEPYTTDKIIAEHSGNSLHAVKVLIYNHKQDFEDFGILSFEMTKLPGRGRPQKTYHLNEQQATFLITMLDNTPQVKQFKKSLVREFYAMKQELTQRQINRAIEKPQRKTLMAAVKSWPNAPRHIYINMTQLLLKRATGGMTAQQIKKERHVKTALDGLTVKEQARYEQLENIAIGLVSLNKTWDEVKGVLLLA
ncbi:MAG: Rha family transcriptional regulator [Limosilactobacillus oris]|jgi:phage regulator Rha-like protein|uniref:Rha family transcriptional regulator n=1 Tax=Limosilactobacillus oris TaxID=1632 RepID=UPI00242C3034|nr:Rha family transcriptional regulator [Limosilactobacillus oris]MCH3912033.1 Rha family transcriptional regulator [Limosilactobacillus oris]MCH3939285.1 Rha family transcriptional regulator [Limosilactobacillus oris]MCI1980825.1 Rha family transcriptional regulator [Limosilactobacillus oris]MCI2043250.1 Rha family transcriptional regulator [Limosilactobacillus oris]